jgi:MFS transporter, FHS family, L-fucose permease
MSKQNNYTQSLFIFGAFFFIFGFVTWINSSLMPYLKLSCNLDSDTKSFLVTFAFFIAYFVLAIPSSWILKKTGYKKGMSLGLLVMALGAALFIPAAKTRIFEVFLLGLFIIGSGLALLQTAVNPYVSIIGPIETAAQRISIMGICNKVAGFVGPTLFAVILLNNAAEVEKSIAAATDIAVKNQILDTLAARVITPYTILTIVLILFAIAIYFIDLPEIQEEKTNDTAFSANKKSIFDFPHTILGALAIFFYVGAEVMAGDIIPSYGKNLGFTGDQTKYFTQLTLIAMVIGYIVSLFIIPKMVKQEQWLKISSILGIVITVIAYFASDNVAIACIAGLGFANAVMWPAIFPLGIDGLGRFTQIGSALLIMGIAGGAIIPQIYGALTPALGFKAAFLACMIPCYLYVLYFAMAGYKVGRK